MPDDREHVGAIVSFKELNKLYPTNFHSPGFWEELGRTIATFGFLENCLTKAIFAYEMIREYEEEELEEAYLNFVKRMEVTASDALGSLVDKFGKVVRDHREPPFDGFEELISELKKATHYRNVICHGFWEKPDTDGKSRPFFVNKKREIFDMPIDQEFLSRIRVSALELCCHVINSVTARGWQFPSSGGPGRPIST